MKNFEFKKGALSYVDLAFAESVLKRLGSQKEEHAALLAVLFALSRLGHLTLDLSSDAFDASLKLLEVENLKSLLLHGAENFPYETHAWICRFNNHLYLQKNWACETEILFHLNRLSKSLPAVILKEPVLSYPLNSQQQKAVSNGLQNSLSLLTGGPGTGKTFTAAELVKSCLLTLPKEQQLQFRIILTAPTGKAVAQLEGNLKKAIGETACVRSGTLHSILGIKSTLQEDPASPLFADLILVDECSMIDSKVFSRLLSSVQTGTRLILIGDKDQLPPVEAGSIFADLIDAGIYPSIHLTECLRSDSQEILSLAKSIREGVASLSSFSNIEWLDLGEEKKSILQLWESCKERFPSAFLQKPTPEQILARLGEFSVLSCMRQGPLGVDALNSYFLSQSLNQVPQHSWWVAPIMITRNDAELQLFNGDLGFVIRYIGDDFSLRQFQIDDYILVHDRKTGYRQIPALAVNAFEYNYCQSVHKSQGSEYSEVLILVPKGSQSFGREVLYTALTRAKNKAAFAGCSSALLQCIASSSRKTSGLQERLK